MPQGRRRESPPVPLPASLGATSGAGDMSDIRPDILEMIKEEQKVSQHHVDNACSQPVHALLYVQYTVHMQACTCTIYTKDNPRAVQEKIVSVLPL